MKKPAIIIGKKQIILSCLTVMLGVAVYLNYVLAQKPAIDDSAPVGASSDESLTYGEALYVDSDNAADLSADKLGSESNEIPVAAEGVSSEEYFAQARLEKISGRDEAVQTLQSIIGGGDLTEDEQVVKALEAVELSKLIESESRIESLVKARGYADCIAYLDKNSAKVIVKTDGLEPPEAAAIKDIICGEVDALAEEIRIIEIK